MENNNLNRLYCVIDNFTKYQKNTIPLCAAENALSDFCKIPLHSDLQERYIMGNTYSYSGDDNFIGSEYLFPIYALISDFCKRLFGAQYSDARTLTGMNCLTTLLMSLTKVGDKIAVLPSAWGGHPSVYAVCERLGLTVYNLPYDCNAYDIDYYEANKLLNSERIQYILLAPSDIIKPLAVEQFDLYGRELFYDISQIMGLIAGSAISNPLSDIDNIVLFGGTHKTFPGPASGLILCNNVAIHQRLEKNINPTYLRNTQMHQVASLLFALYEMACYGDDYANAIVKMSNQLGTILQKRGFHVANIRGRFSETHQLFIHCDKNVTDNIGRNAIRFGITLNKKNKSLFNSTGIRLGTQEIARYGWSGEELENIGNIMTELRKSDPNPIVIEQMKSKMPTKTLRYTFPSDVYDIFYNALHEEKI